MTDSAATENGSTLVRPGNVAYWSASCCTSGRMRPASGMSERSLSAPRSMKRAISML
ncbi:hypothetical protein FHX71_000660 [Promicromonospora sukumoe]|uniref:Uncharacterized protein n=1 Tax=Promicromonospora sukumoe TaxID=88382 RepID=A0A7W3J5M9_9MICO|nr:hypothetical protein [Promicromonospora sukumoe]